MATWDIGAVQDSGATDIGAVQSAPAVPTGIARPKVNASLAAGTTSIGKLVGAVIIILLLGI